MGERSKLMKDFWRGGELFVWMTASGVALSLLMVAGMLGLIMINGLGQFWPGALQETTLKTQETVIGQVVGEEVIPNSITPDSPTGQRRFRYRVGNRDVFGSEYRWINAADIVSSAHPEDLTLVERREWGPAFGRITCRRGGGRDRKRKREFMDGGEDAGGAGQSVTSADRTSGARGHWIHQLSD
jgi:phosphate transport system permease protein